MNIQQNGFTGKIIGVVQHGYLIEYKVKLLLDKGNYKKNSIVYLFKE